MPNDFERIADQLDQDYPDWWLRWANQQQLMDLALTVTLNRAKDNIRTRHYNTIIHRVLNAALSAGVVTLPNKD